jgi:tetratricopeptide (TPR) repeat protein
VTARTDDHSLDDDDGVTPAALPYGPSRVALDLAVRQLDQAELNREPSEMSEALASVARCYRSLSAWSPALDYMQQALRWAHVSGGVDQRVNLLCELAELACSTSESILAPDGQESRAARECARDHAFEAARVAVHAADSQWEIKVLLRVSDVLDRCGDHDDAITLQTRALTLMSRPDAGCESRQPHAATPPQLM